MQPFASWARARLPGPPARLLEVGCGQGELTTSLAASGYDVLGIDPAAPYGDRFRRIKLEDLDASDGPFDGVVAAHALHHVRDLEHAVGLIGELLGPEGVLVLDEVAWDLADESTLDWLYGRRRALAAAGQGEAPADLTALREEWDAAHLGVHGYAALRAAIDDGFEERDFAWTPYLYRELGGVAGEVLEQALIDGGAIPALGFRYAGVVRRPTSPRGSAREAGGVDVASRDDSAGRS